MKKQRKRTARCLLVPAAALLFVSFSGGCSEKKAPQPSGGGTARKKEKAEELEPAFEIGKPNLVLIVVDTLRFDHVGSGKGEDDGSITKNIDALAQTGVRFSTAYSNAPWTFPAHASLFTGFGPEVHKQTHAVVYDKDGGPAVKEEAYLPGRFETLAAVLRKNGYQTIGISQNPWVGRFSTQNTGFERFWELWSETQQFPFTPRAGDDLEMDKVAYAFRHFLDKIKRGESPFFLFVNYITCHLPYTPEARFRNKHVRGFPPDSVFTLTSHNWLERKDAGQLGEEEIGYLQKLYRAEVEQVDAAIGEVVALLKSRDAFDNTLFIVTSDHGECIGHHGLFDHQFNLFDDLVKIPLVMHHPKLSSGKTVSVPVQLSDIFPTVLELFGLRGERRRLKLPGMVIPLDPAREGKAPPGGRPLFFLYRKGSRVLRLAKEHISEAMFQQYNRDLCGVRKGKWKLILTDAGTVFLYDMETDPQEKNNLTDDAHKTVVEELLSLLRTHYQDASLPFSRLK